MPKTTVSYWNPLVTEHKNRWLPLSGLEGLVEELTLSIDHDSGEYTRLTRFYPGADTSVYGGNCHAYPEEIIIVSARLFDVAYNTWLETGHYANRPPGELHEPFKTDIGCVVQELSFRNRTE